MSEGLAYVEGSIVDLHEARIPLNDRGYLLGDGVFETLRTSNGRVFRHADHEERFKQGLRAIGLDTEVVSEYNAALDALLTAGREKFGDELYLRVQTSTGPMDDVLESDRGVLVTGICKRFRPYPMQYFATGVQVIVSRQLKDSRNPLCGIKSLSFLPYIAARREAHAVTAHDALLLNENGRIAEATTSNVFAMRDGIVYAPGAAEGAINGVTRTVVLELLAEAEVPVEEAMDVAVFRRADEAWLTNTTGAIVPITRFGENTIGKGVKGDLTIQLSHALEALIRGPA